MKNKLMCAAPRRSCRALRAVTAVIAAALIMLFSFAAPASALDDTFRFDDFGMSVKIPKSYYVVTRDSQREDDVFSALRLDYDEIMTAFHAAEIYLRAYDPDGVFQISLTVITDEHIKAINNYSDLSDSERRDILDALLAEPGISSAVELKHGGNIFFDSSRETTLDGKPLFINQCNTVINGLQIDISMQKAEEAIVSDEAKTLTAVAASMSFDKITLKESGPVFDWWRLLLWAVILAGMTLLISLIFKKNNAAKHRKLEERRRRRAAASEAVGADAGDGTEYSFNELLGYYSDEQFESRAPADLEGYDISVEEKDPNSGVSYFEDEGESIDTRTDYFDTFFKEPTETKSGLMRLLSTIGAYIGIAFRHIGYFFKNLFKRKKKNDEPR